VGNKGGSMIIEIEKCKECIQGYQYTCYEGWYPIYDREKEDEFDIVFFNFCPKCGEPLFDKDKGPYKYE